MIFRWERFWVYDFLASFKKPLLQNCKIVYIIHEWEKHSWFYYETRGRVLVNTAITFTNTSLPFGNLLLDNNSKVVSISFSTVRIRTSLATQSVPCISTQILSPWRRCDFTPFECLPFFMGLLPPLPIPYRFVTCDGVAMISDGSSTAAKSSTRMGTVKAFPNGSRPPLGKFRKIFCSFS